MKNLVTIIIVSFKSNNIIEESIKSINKEISIIVVENSEDIKLKEKLEKKYKNVKVILNKNKGFGQAANLGAKKSKNKYILFSSPDIIFKVDPVKSFIDIAKKLQNKFGLLIPSNNKKGRILKIKEPFGTPIIFVERRKFLKMKGYDENFFLYFEDTDFVQRFIKKNENVYKVPLVFRHKFGSHNKIYNNEIELNRNWHYMWSKFYYLKKTEGILFAYVKTLPTLFRALIKSCFFYLSNKKKYLIYKARFLGLINSYFNKKSWYRPQIQ
tara:strand:+ start:92 stop:898 length:807 start_codon:yes stop_codon:yes gene_type:complete